MIVFITGGAKNGKSSLAQELTLRLAAGGKRYYIATMIPSDEEDNQRIRHHILDREGMGFETLEQGRNIAACLEHADTRGAFLLDSVTALLLNELFPDPTMPDMDETAVVRCRDGLEQLCTQVQNIVLVSDYIYSDAQLYDRVTETYRCGLAQLDRFLAGIADTVIECSGGCTVLYKGELPE